MTLDNIAFEEAPIGIVMTEQRVIRACNNTFARMVGYAKSQLVGQSFRMLYATGDEFDRMRDVGLAPLMRDEFYSDERMIRTAENTMIWCRFRAHSLTPDIPLAQVVMSFALISDRPPIALSPRERQVLGGIGRGQTSKEIARELGLSHRTIEDVRARLLRRFSVRSTVELLAKLTVFDH
jgi:PAS domain S-box-containing protein